jgi:polyphosphate glucokinase
MGLVKSAIFSGFIAFKSCLPLMKSADAEEKILAIDIGGSHIKATILDTSGKMLMDYEKIETPSPADPDHVMKAIVTLTEKFPSYTKVSSGFPGYVRNGKVMTAPNLGTERWQGVDLAKQLTATLNKPVRVVNDADMQGLGIATGPGLEMVVTLGTGFGTALLHDGTLLPHLELAHHPVSKDRTYDEYVGEKALEEVGAEHWNRRMKKVIGILRNVFNYDHLYIGGGNSRKIDFKTDETTTLVSNRDGIKGGARLWDRENHYGV